MLQAIEDASWKHYRLGDSDLQRKTYQVGLLESKMREMYWIHKKEISEMQLEILKAKKGLDNGHADRF